MDFGHIRLQDSSRLSFKKGANQLNLQAPTTISNTYTWTFPSDNPPSTQALVVSSTGVISYQTLGGGGTVTSVGLSLPAIFSVSGSPVTSSGTLTATLASQSANLFFASPNGSAGSPTFRAIAWADVSGLGGTSGTSFALGNDGRLHSQNTDTGTSQASFQIDSGNSGFRLKNNTGNAEIRNNLDNAFANLTVNNLTVQGSTLTVNGQAVTRAFETTFTNATLVSGVLTVTHNLGRRVVSVTIADNSFNKIGAPDNIVYTSTTALTVDLTSFGTLTGTWTVVCS